MTQRYHLSISLVRLLTITWLHYLLVYVLSHFFRIGYGSVNAYVHSDLLVCVMFGLPLCGRGLCSTMLFSLSTLRRVLHHGLRSFWLFSAGFTLQKRFFPCFHTFLLSVYPNPFYLTIDKGNTFSCFSFLSYVPSDDIKHHSLILNLLSKSVQGNLRRYQSNDSSHCLCHLHVN